jgi:hypothetical protein
MPKFSKNKKKIIGGLLQEMGCSESMTDVILRSAQAETEQEGISATKDLHRVLLENLRQQQKQGIRFGEADLQEFLGQDEIPPEFQELLKNNKSLTKAEPSGPKIAFEPPVGWSSEHVSFTLNIRKGRKTIGVISVIDDFSFDLRLKKNESREKFLNQNLDAASGNVGWAKSPVRFGDSHGYKYLYIQTEPSWKSVQYLLEVPGGKVNVTLDGGGKNFDEAAFEAQLKTLQISQAA